MSENLDLRNMSESELKNIIITKLKNNYITKLYNADDYETYKENLINYFLNVSDEEKENVLIQIGFKGLYVRLLEELEIRVIKNVEQHQKYVAEIECFHAHKLTKDDFDSLVNGAINKLDQ